MHFEFLEARRLLAGNVTAAFADNTITIFGDGQSNQVQVVSDNPFGGYTIHGQDGTTINGAPAVVFPLTGDVLDPPSLIVRLGNGDDRLTLSVGGDASFFSDLTDIDTGNGDDEILSDFWGCFGLTIKTGNGNDHIDVIAVSTVVDAFSIDMGNGNDHLKVDTAAANDDSLSIAMGNGNDRVELSQIFALETLSVDLGNGNDSQTDRFLFAGTIFFDGGTGRDALDSQDRFSQNPETIVNFE